MTNEQQRALESFLAWLYASPHALDAFLRAPDDTMAAAGLDAKTSAAMHAADRVGLVMAARSYGHKRDSRHRG